jgi:hypothetical protein
MIRIIISILLITLVFLTSGIYSAQSAPKPALPSYLSSQNYNFPPPSYGPAQYPGEAVSSESIILLGVACVAVSAAMGGLIYGSRFVATRVGG